MDLLLGKQLAGPLVGWLVMMWAVGMDWHLAERMADRLVQRMGSL
jgi:hypothetical protein